MTECRQASTNNRGASVISPAASREDANFQEVLEKSLMCRSLAGLWTAFCLIIVGCGGGEPIVPTVSVNGKVLFQGAAVSEGVVTFEESKKGYASSAPLKDTGEFSLRIPVGNYQVTVMPPKIQTPGGPDSPPGEGFKTVANIPGKYWASSTSGLTAPVGDKPTLFSFEMTAK